MNVVCADGTQFTCTSYELTDKGVKLYSADVEEMDDASARYASDDSDEFQIGFVPESQLQYILPDGVVPAGRQNVGAPQQSPGTIPPAGQGGPNDRRGPMR
jgi:hypothetical protein